MVKKLFPGVSEQDLTKKIEDAKEQVQQKVAQDSQIKKSKKDFEKKLNFLNLRFNHNKRLLAAQAAGFIISQSLFLGCLYGSFLKDTKEYKSAGDDYKKSESHISITDIKAKEKGELTYYLNPIKEFYKIFDFFGGDTKSYTTKDFNDHRSDRAGLGLLAILFSVGVVAIMGIGHDYVASKYVGHYSKSFIKDKMRDILQAWEENDLEKLDGIVKGWLGSTNPDQQDKVIRKVVQHLSSKDRVMFDKLLNEEKDVSFNTCVQIMIGHLKSHPEDIKLIMDAFDERSIPEEIKKKYVDSTRE